VIISLLKAITSDGQIVGHPPVANYMQYSYLNYENFFYKYTNIRIISVVWPNPYCTFDLVTVV